ncbi:MAG: radical SAM protein [Syntrophobacterales bacterium]|jgi:hypothetical protein|nr:radical SAM protein [Syntrophobacterales bacterium]
MILIHPPIVKPSEPPPGMARLMGACRAHGVACRLVDANLEGILFLLGMDRNPYDTWGKRAVKNMEQNLSSLRDRLIYSTPDRYRRVVFDVNKVLEMAALEKGVHVGLGNYRNTSLSPVKSADLIRAAEEPENNPFYPYFRERLSGIIEEEQSAFAGFSLNYLSQALTAFAMIGYLKRKHPDMQIVLGGGLVTSWMKRPGWSNLFGGLVDHLIAGPGEKPLLSLAGKEASARPHILPVYDDLPMDRYLSPRAVLPYSASSGCYWNQCAFCPEKAEGSLYVKTADKSVALDLRELSEKVMPSMIHITDNAISPSLMRTLAKNPPGAPWYGFARITQHLADPDLCYALKISGCVMLKLGLESGDQGVLEAMQKGSNLATASKVLTTLKDVGIATYVYLLFGTPSETEKEARKTLRFSADHADCIDFLNVAIFNMPVNSEEGKRLNTGEFYEGNLSLYSDFVHPKGWGRREVRIFLDKEFKRHPAIAPIIRRDPPIFTSNHAPFFVQYNRR